MAWNRYGGKINLEIALVNSDGTTGRTGPIFALNEQMSNRFEGFGDLWRPWVLRQFFAVVVAVPLSIVYRVR